MQVNLSIKIFSERINLFLKRISIFVLFSFSFYFYACSDNPSSIGADLLKNDYLNINELDSYKDTLAQTSSYLKRSIKLGSGYRLFVGKTENVEASSLINFNIPLSDSIKSGIKADSIIIIGAKIRFTRDYTFGDNNSSYDFTVHKIQSGWTSAGFTSDSLSMLSYDPADISFNKKLTDSTDEFEIDKDLAFSWLKYSTDSLGNNYGIYIKPTESSQKIVGYNALYSTGDSTEPVLSIVLERPGRYVDSLIFSGYSDVSAVSGNIPAVTQSNIIVQGGLVVNAKLWFDVSKVPFNAVINTAEVTLNLDSSKTFIGDTTSTILAAFLTDSSSIVLDSSVVVTFSRTHNYMTGTITSFVKKWVDSKINQGILLFPRSEISNLDLFTIRGSNAADSLKPRLHIIYTTKK